MFNSKTFLRIISLIAAILLWAYVMGEVDPEKRGKVDVHISYTNEDILAEEGLAAVVGDNMTTTAVIKGKRSEVNEINKTGLTAYIDVSSCKKGKNKMEIIVNTPDGISLENIAEEYLTVKVEDLAEEEKPLNVGFIEKDKIVAKDGEKIPWIIATDPETISVTGSRSAVEKVSEVRGNVSSKRSTEYESRWVYVSAVAVDENGEKVEGVTIENSENIRALIRTLTVKTVDVEISTRDIEDGFEIDEIKGVESAVVLGSQDMIDSIDSIDGVLDMSGITGTDFNEASVQLIVPEGIYLYNGEDTVSVKVKLKTVQ